MKITSLRLVTNPRRWECGDTLLAFFNVNVAGVQMRDCMLIRGGRTGELIAQPPRGETARGERAVRFVDPQTRKAISEAAVQAFLDLGGDVEAA